MSWPRRNRLLAVRQEGRRWFVRRRQLPHDEVTQITNVGSEIKAGGDIGLISGSDQRYQVAKLDSNKDLTLQSGGYHLRRGEGLHKEDHRRVITLCLDQHERSRQHRRNPAADADVGQGQLVIKAVDGLHIDVKQINEQTVSQAIDAMVQADRNWPGSRTPRKRGDATGGRSRNCTTPTATAIPALGLGDVGDHHHCHGADGRYRKRFGGVSR
ncbi:Putative large exoprotein involved in heme utilization or adhesion of ShlA/HecA/FhaA family [Pseudomonas sp. FEN]|nr:Putative large exoprotein involved in heme utilization or adhesion of ShlA/HecA/FhaA family [Pseudomonas sp. FEN]